MHYALKNVQSQIKSISLFLAPSLSLSLSSKFRNFNKINQIKAKTVLMKMRRSVIVVVSIVRPIEDMI